jgi:hypothetical protein
MYKIWLRFLNPKPEGLYTLVKILLNWILEEEWRVSVVTGCIFHKIQTKYLINIEVNFSSPKSQEITGQLNDYRVQKYHH